MLAVPSTAPSELSPPNLDSKDKSINPSANLPLAFNTGTLFSSPAPLDVFTNTEVSAVSISRSSVSDPQGVPTDLLSPSPAVSLLSNTSVVVSFTVIETFVSAHPHEANVDRSTSGLLPSLNLILAPSSSVVI